jgi:hypothetical protein
LSNPSPNDTILETRRIGIRARPLGKDPRHAARKSYRSSHNIHLRQPSVDYVWSLAGNQRPERKPNAGVVIVGRPNLMEINSTIREAAEMRSWMQIGHVNLGASRYLSGRENG